MASVTPSRPLPRTTLLRLRRELPVGERIRFARRRANLTLDGLAAQAGTSRQHLIRLEKGQHRPKPTMAARIAEATGTPTELFEDDDEESDPVADLIAALSRFVDHKLTVRA